MVSAVECGAPIEPVHPHAGAAARPTA
jgi:hypothetical protein